MANTNRVELEKRQYNPFKKGRVRLGMRETNIRKSRKCSKISRGELTSGKNSSSLVALLYFTKSFHAFGSEALPRNVPMYLRISDINFCVVLSSMGVMPFMKGRRGGQGGYFTGIILGVGDSAGALKE
jgi:nitrate/nitrite transporter NarK